MNEEVQDAYLSVILGRNIQTSALLLRDLDGISDLPKRLSNPLAYCKLTIADLRDGTGEERLCYLRNFGQKGIDAVSAIVQEKFGFEIHWTHRRQW